MKSYRFYRKSIFKYNSRTSSQRTNRSTSDKKRIRFCKKL